MAFSMQQVDSLIIALQLKFNALNLKLELFLQPTLGTSARYQLDRVTKVHKNEAKPQSTLVYWTAEIPNLSKYNFYVILCRV